MDQEFTTLQDIRDNYDEQIKYYGLNPKSDALVFSDNLSELYRLLLQAGSAQEKERSQEIQMIPKQLQSIFDVESKITFIEEVYCKLTEFCHDLLSQTRWQDINVGMSAFTQLYLHNIQNVNLTDQHEKIKTLIMGSYVDNLESKSDVLANETINCLSQIGKYVSKTQINTLFESVCIRINQINVQDLDESCTLLTSLSEINKNQEVRILKHSKLLVYKFKSQWIHLKYYKTLLLCSDHGENDNELLSLAMYQGVQHSDIEIRQISLQLAMKYQKSPFFSQCIVPFLQITLFDETLLVRKESTQIIKDLIPGLDNDEKKVFQLVINELNYLKELFGFLFFNQQVDQLKQDSNLCCQQISDNQQKLCVESSLIRILNLCVLQCNSQQKAAVHTIGRLINLMKGNVIISEVSNDICDLLLEMNHSRDIALLALWSLQPLLDSFENILNDTRYLHATIEMVFFSLKRSDEKNQIPMKSMYSILTRRGQETLLEYIKNKLQQYNIEEKGRLSERLAILFSELSRRKEHIDLQTQLLILIVRVVQEMMVDRVHLDVITNIYLNVEDGFKAQQKESLKQMIEQCGLNEVLQKDIKMAQSLLKIMEEQLGKPYMLQKYKHVY